MPYIPLVTYSLYARMNSDVNRSTGWIRVEASMGSRSRKTFKSGGTECVGYIYRAEGSSEPSPCVVMAHGFGGTQEGSIAATAAEISQAGLTVFTFDYRCFGESSGEPRQVININDQLEDWRSAIAFARSLPDGDPDAIALWGSSLAGGHVIEAAASDGRVAAVVSQIPFTFGFPRKVEGRTFSQTWRLLRVSLHDWFNGLRRRPRIYIPAVGPQGSLAVMATGEAEKQVSAMMNATWRNEIAPGVLIDMTFWYRPGRRARNVNCPIFFSLAENDREGPIELALRAARLAPLGEVRRYPCSHFDFYDSEIRRTIIQDQVSFLVTRLIGLRRT